MLDTDHHSRSSELRMNVCMYVTSSLLKGISDRKNGIHIKFFQGSGIVLKLSRTSQRPVRSLDYDKKTLFNAVLPDTFTNSMKKNFS